MSEQTIHVVSSMNSAQRHDLVASIEARVALGISDKGMLLTVTCVDCSTPRTIETASAWHIVNPGNWKCFGCKGRASALPSTLTEFYCG
jgi:hypothetical protein